MTSRVLVDTGPLVAIVSKNDAYHRICTDTLREIAPPMLTCWPVLTEVTWLLRKHPSAIQKVFDSVESGLLRVEDLDHAAVPWIARFLKRYRKLGAQLADAALVYLAERDGRTAVFTLDRRDFSVYRLSRNRSLELLPRLS